VKHFGRTGGYNYLQFKFKHDVASKTLELTHTLSGPVAGIGPYCVSGSRACLEAVDTARLQR